MAVFDQRRELNQQGRHIPFQTDDSFGLKLLGYDKYGKNNAWGHVLNYAPGINTGRHAIAKASSTGETKKVLDDTFDEAINLDFAGMAFGANIAKMIVGGGGGGMGSMMGGAGGAAGQVGGQAGGLSSIMSKTSSSASSGGGSFMNMFNKGGGTDFGKGMNDIFSGMNKNSIDTNMLSDATNAMKNQNNSDSNNELTSEVQRKINENLINPYPLNSPEYDAFEEKRKTNSKSNPKVGSELQKGASSFFKSATSGNIFESGANFGSAIVTDYKAKNEAFKEYARGNMAQSTFNYL